MCITTAESQVIHINDASADAQIQATRDVNLYSMVKEGIMSCQGEQRSGENKKWWLVPRRSRTAGPRPDRLKALSPITGTGGAPHFLVHHRHRSTTRTIPGPQNWATYFISRSPALAARPAEPYQRHRPALPCPAPGKYTRGAGGRSRARTCPPC